MSQITVALPDENIQERLGDSLGDASVIVWKVGDAPLGRPIDLLVLPYITTYATLARLEPGAVSVVQGQSLGFDGVAEFLPAGTIYCNAVGVHEVPSAELALALVLSAQRGLVEFAQAQPRGLWNRPMLPGLAGRRVLLIGVGGVGREIEKRILPFDVELTRVGRTARDDIHAQSELSTLLPHADIVILAVPLGDGTHHLADAAFLDAMAPGALLVNISRGPVVDTDALTERVASGALRAALDVMEPEPLPPGHPLWTLPGVTLTPHVGGNVLSMGSRIDPLIRRQAALLSGGHAPLNVVLGDRPTLHRETSR
jgi:phosphoglycerate dehydrogenase-like enzyme